LTDKQTLNFHTTSLAVVPLQFWFHWCRASYSGKLFWI